MQQIRSWKWEGYEVAPVEEALEEYATQVERYAQHGGEQPVVQISVPWLRPEEGGEPGAAPNAPRP